MKQNIEFDPVEGIFIVIAPEQAVANSDDTSHPTWTVYLLNDNDFALDNVLISAEGYGTQPSGEAVRTSTLRYRFEQVAAHSATQVELIDPAVFHLTNQYWVSYYQDSRIFDKKFLFGPHTIGADNLSLPALLHGRAAVVPD